MLEAGPAGTLLLTDDKDRTRLFWTPGTEYGYFCGIDDLPAVARGFLSDPARLDSARLAFARRARDLARTGLWGGVEDGLRLRGLPSLST